MTLSGNGSEELAIGEHNGDVVISVPKGVDWIKLDPETARRVGETLCREAYKVRYGVPADGSRSLVSEALRMRLVTRATHIIRSLQDHKKLPGVIASEVVDTILAEIS